MSFDTRPHCRGFGQTTPQVPQLLLSLFGFDSQPFVGIMSQSTQPESQVPTSHLPMTQAGVAWGTEQGAPHAPQFCGSVPVSVSQPLPGLPSQSEYPGTHVMLQVSAPFIITQVAVAFELAGTQAVQLEGPQPYIGSVTETHVPLHIFSVALHWPPSPPPAAVPPPPSGPPVLEVVILVPVLLPPEPPLPSAADDSLPFALQPAQAEKRTPNASATRTSVRAPEANVVDGV